VTWRAKAAACVRASSVRAYRACTRVECVRALCVCVSSARVRGSPNNTTKRRPHHCNTQLCLGVFWKSSITGTPVIQTSAPTHCVNRHRHRHMCVQGRGQKERREQRATGGAEGKERAACQGRGRRKGQSSVPREGQCHSAGGHALVAASRRSGANGHAAERLCQPLNRQKAGVHACAACTHLCEHNVRCAHSQCDRPAFSLGQHKRHRHRLRHERVRGRGSGTTLHGAQGLEAPAAIV